MTAHKDIIGHYVLKIKELSISFKRRGGAKKEEYLLELRFKKDIEQHHKKWQEEQIP